MEYCERGDLAGYIAERRKSGRPIKEAKILNWFTQITMALEHVHGKKILHRDIKSSNIFLTKSNTVKLGDFGICKLLTNTCDKAYSVVGTPYYMSPEICE
jgi:NIMA (never in mitosis gene a)-related kinase